ncbi:MAG: 2-hydroxyhepta-2,4-diene-1,7-dioate isomerase [Saprospiraceae bacterium]|nr:MAG: 2-hydroxyhepta-2,4-diene-1,7-dioate isomerase [Saprospiraceae bacterium]
MKLYHTTKGILIEQDNKYYLIENNWDAFINNDNLYPDVLALTSKSSPFKGGEELIKNHLLPPVESQEIWASGVTYFSSREARMEESKDAGGGDFYDRVYHADRPEVFFKSPAYRAVGHRQHVRIRRDSKWNVPEPELTLVITSSGKIIGYTIGNDMSSRDIEGENPLYLPQAKSYDGAAAIGPCVFITQTPLPKDTNIQLEIFRGGSSVFVGKTDIGQIKREFTDLVEYLYRETTFKFGCLLMTGTGIVPPDSFTLDHGDEISITIDHIGILKNIVA